MNGWLRNLLKSGDKDASASPDASTTQQEHIFTKQEIHEMAHRACDEQKRQHREYESTRHLESDYRLATAIRAVCLNGQKTDEHIRELLKSVEVCAYWASVKMGGPSAMDEEAKRLSDAKTAMRRSDVPLTRHQSKDPCRVIQSLLPTYRGWGDMLMQAGVAPDIQAALTCRNGKL